VHRKLYSILYKADPAREKIFCIHIKRKELVCKAKEFTTLGFFK
jgi:hypothetical protein